jgi:8-oxo-dGTP pyrophosphatase MutT (NUDIX family)
MSYIRDLRNSLIEEKKHMPILQDGAAIIVVNNKGEILLQSRADRDKWGLPGGCQELGETFEQVALREVKEETNLDAKEEDLILIGIVSGKSRYNTYPNGDEVYNNTVLFLITNYTGELRWDSESKKMEFKSLDDLPENLMDKDLIERYKVYKIKN